MAQTLSFEEFEARYGQPASQPRTLTFEQFEAREAAPADGSLVDKPQNIEEMIRSVESRTGIREGRRAELVNAPRTAQKPGFFGHLGRSGERGFRSLQQLRNLYGMQLGEDPETNIARIAELERIKRSLPASEALQKFGRAKTFDEAFEAFLDAPLDVSGNLAVESLAQFAPGLPLAAGLGAAGGSVAGPLGTAAGLAAGVGGTSFLIEYGHKIFESMSEAGVDLTDAAQITAAFADAEFMDQARERAIRKGVPVAVFDAISGGIAGRLLLAAPKHVAAKLAAGAGEIAIQSGLGASGEAAGQLVERGEITSPPDILAEAIAELGPGAAQVGVGVALQQRRQEVAPRLEPTIAPRTATPDTILELTERARPEPVPAASAVPSPEIPRTAERPATSPTVESPAPPPVLPEGISPVPRVGPSIAEPRILTVEQFEAREATPAPAEEPVTVRETQPFTGYTIRESGGALPIFADEERLLKARTHPDAQAFIEQWGSNAYQALAGMQMRGESPTLAEVLTEAERIATERAAERERAFEEQKSPEAQRANEEATAKALADLDKRQVSELDLEKAGKLMEQLPGYDLSPDPDSQFGYAVYAPDDSLAARGNTAMEAVTMALERPAERDVPFKPRTLTVEQFDAREAAPSQPKPRQRPIRRKPLSLAEFVAAEGGMRDETGELKAMDAHLWHRSKPYRSRLVRDDGIPPEDMRLKAQEAGYVAEGTITGDFYELLRRDLSETGQKVYSQADLGEVETRRAQAASVIDRAELEHYADRLDIPREAMDRLDDNALANAITNEQAARGVSEESGQIDIPGAERISDRAFAERRMEQPLRPGAGQKPADEGLFDVARRGQTEMFTFPGPLPALKQQWHRAATEIIDWLAEGQYSPFARYLGGYPFKDPTMGRLPERGEYLGKRGETQGTIYRTNRVASRLNDALRKAPEEDQRAALDYLTTEGAEPRNLPLSVRGAAVAAKSAIKKVGRELVRRGLLSQEAYDRHADAYLPRVYLKHLMERSGFGAGLKISDQGYLKQRTDLPEEYRDLYLGEIKDVGFLVTKAISQPARDLAMQDFLRDLSRNPEWVLPESLVEWTAPGMSRPRKVTPFWLKAEAQALRRRGQAMPDLEQRARAKEIADGMDALADDALAGRPGVPKDFRRMPDSPRYGDLRGLVVRKEIYSDIVGAGGMWVGEKGAYDKTFDKLASFNAWWKMMKVPFNPPTQIRNFVSNGILLDISGVPFQRLPSLYARAFVEIRKNGKHYRIAVKHGIPASTFTAAELYRIQPDLLRIRGEKGGVAGRLYRMAEPLSRIAKAPGDLYQFSETWGKVVKIIDAMEREGLSEREAVAAAQETLFDYSLVPNLVKSLRTRAIGAPFITFYFKAFPAVLKGAIKHPGKMAKYYLLPYLLGDMLVAGLKDVDDEDVKKLRMALPGWLRDQGHVYLYPYQDESGRWAFVNYGYFLPWAMHERTARNAMQVATGEYGGSVNDFMSEVGVLGGPVPQIISALMTGVDPWTGREIIKDTDPPREQIYKLMMYAWRMGGPSFLTDQGVLGHMQRSLTQTPNYYGDAPLSPEQAAGRAVGVNIYPVDPAQSRGRNIRRKVYEIREQERAMKRALRHRGLDKAARKDVIEQHRERIKQLVKDLREYKKRSEVHPNLRALRAKPTRSGEGLGVITIRPGGVQADSQ